jgi:hypothetical protein
MRYFIYNYIGSSKESNTVIFDYKKFFSNENLLEDVKRFYTYNERCKNGIYIYPQINHSSREGVINKIADILNKPVEDIKLLPFNEEGFNDEILSKEVLRGGLLDIIKRRNAILESDSTFH